MRCPYPDCGEEIPDDLPTCDMCGRDIVRCNNPDCPDCGKAFIATARNCDMCGEPTIPNGGGAPSVQQSQAAPQAQVQQSASAQGAAHGATEFIPMSGGGSSQLLFHHASEGWSLALADGDILGRTVGNHVSKLGNIKVISGQHAKITHTADGWFITDLGSTNKTWVNSVQVNPQQPMKIQMNDVVTLANVRFTVTEA